MLFKNLLPLLTLATVALAHPQPYHGAPDAIELDAREANALVEAPIDLEERDEPVNVERDEDHVERDEYLNVERTDLSVEERDAFEAAIRSQFGDGHELVARDSTGRCPAGKRAVSNGVKPVANGCGPAGGIKVPPFTFGVCCDTHDRCYGDCSKSKVLCDTVFNGCMIMMCFRLNPFLAEQCLRASAACFAAVVVAGKKAFDAATKKHCKCV